MKLSEVKPLIGKHNFPKEAFCSKICENLNKIFLLKNGSWNFEIKEFSTIYYSEIDQILQQNNLKVSPLSSESSINGFITLSNLLANKLIHYSMGGIEKNYKISNDEPQKFSINSIQNFFEQVTVGINFSLPQISFKNKNVENSSTWVAPFNSGETFFYINIEDRTQENHEFSIFINTAPFKL